MTERLRRSDSSGPGIRRIRSGRGFRYVGPDGDRLSARELDRVRALVLPPAWTDVWICPDASGHLQATGRDAAGRLQYRYHDQWRTERDAAKHDRMLAFAAVLPELRDTVGAHLQARGFGRERVLAGAVRLIDLGFFRSGGDAYAAANETYGIATVRREHVRCVRGTVLFEYPAKHSIPREQAVAEESVCRLVNGLRRRSDPHPELLAYRSGGRWHDVRARDINEYLHEVSGGNFTAKDFRTWHATVLAAVGLAVSTRVAENPSARRRAVARVVREVADYLGNTPAVARSSYIDPRVIERYDAGVTIGRHLSALGRDGEPGQLATAGAVEAAVARMLGDERLAEATEVPA